MRKAATMIRVSVIALAVCAAATLQAATTTVGDERERILLYETWDTDPFTRGWQIEKYWLYGDETEARWHSEDGKTVVDVVRGSVRSPRFAVEANRLYRLCIAAQTLDRALWSVVFFDTNGDPLPADVSSCIEVTSDMKVTSGCFRAWEGAVQASVLIIPHSAPVQLGEVEVARVEKQDVLRWIDDLYATIAPVDGKVVRQPGRLAPLPRTMARLEAGRPLRIVDLGASIGNDLCNSHYALLLERMYPGAEITLAPLIQSGRTCDYWQEEDRVKLQLADMNPDLVLLDCYAMEDLGPVRNVIRQIREQCDAEVLVTALAVVRGMSDEETAKSTAQLAELRRMAEEEGVAFVDLREPIVRYLDAAGDDSTRYQRDTIHFSDAGKQAYGRLLAAFFARDEVR